MRRIVLLGATGLTGRLTAEALTRRGQRPLLAGRDPVKLASLAGRLGELETATVDARDSEGLRRLIGAEDVLVSTAGPFMRLGEAPVATAARSGAHYLDSTGEPPFVRRVFEHHGPSAKRSGAALLTAFGYDFVPGNLAGALALQEAGSDAVRVQVGYFLDGAGNGDTASPRFRPRELLSLASGGTRASLLAVLPERGFAWRHGEIVEERFARRVRGFHAGGRRRKGFSIGSTEHYDLPRAFPQLRRVDTYLGWVDPASRAVQAASLLAAPVTGRRRIRRLLSGAAARAPGLGASPAESDRAAKRSLIVASAHDAWGRQLTQVVLRGPEPYGFTGELLAWGAEQVAGGGLAGSGALGPIEAFGVGALEHACASAGLARGEVTAPA